MGEVLRRDISSSRRMFPQFPSEGFGNFVSFGEISHVASVGFSVEINFIFNLCRMSDIV